MGQGFGLPFILRAVHYGCKWCHNPESQLPKMQKLYTESKCIGAQDCIEICPEDALALTPNGIVTKAEKCTLLWFMCRCLPDQSY